VVGSGRGERGEALQVATGTDHGGGRSYRADAQLGLVDRAERRGLARRVASSSDRRVVLVDLTDAGQAIVSKVSAGFESDVGTLLARLPAADRSSFLGLVSRLLVAHADANGVNLF
jgi:hypothetical protein